MDGLATRSSYFGGGAGWLHLVVRGTHFGVARVGGGPGAGRGGLGGCFGGLLAGGRDGPG